MVGFVAALGVDARLPVGFDADLDGVDSRVLDDAYRASVGDQVRDAVLDGVADLLVPGGIFVEQSSHAAWYAFSRESSSWVSNESSFSSSPGSKSASWMSTLSSSMSSLLPAPRRTPVLVASHPYSPVTAKSVGSFSARVSSPSLPCCRTTWTAMASTDAWLFQFSIPSFRGHSSLTVSPSRLVLDATGDDPFETVVPRRCLGGGHLVEQSVGQPVAHRGPVQRHQVAVSGKSSSWTRSARP